MPRLPPAPGLFSTVTGWPRTFCISLAVARVAMSTAPAGVNGTTMRSGLVGKAWACAPREARSVTAERSKRSTSNLSGLVRPEIMQQRRGAARPIDRYHGGLQEKLMRDVVNIEDLRILAQRRVPKAIFDFFDGGAEDEVTLRGNRAAFERVRLLPKVLVDVSKIDTTVNLFGKESKLPLAIAPTGGISAGRAGAELILARAAKAWGVPFTMATPSAFSIEQVAKEVGGRLWFQLYCVRNIEFRNKLVERAKNAGFEA